MSNLSPTDLMLQARDTAETYFNQSIRIIDSKNEVIPASGKVVALCKCGLTPLPPGQVHDLLQEWIADNPYHARKEHIFAYELFRWLERRSKRGDE
jgi:hypothetical protein